MCRSGGVTTAANSIALSQSAASQALAELADAAGSPDNVTVIVLDEGTVTGTAVLGAAGA